MTAKAKKTGNSAAAAAFAACVLLMASTAPDTALAADAAKHSGYDVAAYVWPAYHPAPRWKELGIFADGKGEWQNLYEAVKRQPCDCLDARPLWGYESEADPVAVARKIDAATSAGVNVFIYDWYWYGGRPFLEDALNNGFLRAQNCERMKFYIMWANHNVSKLWNNKVGTADGKRDVIWPAKVSDEDWRQITARWISMYFSRPNYYRINGCPVLSIYNVKEFVEWDGLAKAKERIADLRRQMVAAGFPGLHLQVVGGWNASRLSKELVELGVNSTTSYSWNDGTWMRMNDEGKPELEYRDWGELALKVHDTYRDDAKKIGMTYFPNITIGWDTNARYPVSETKRIVRNSNPADFERFSRRVKDWADANLVEPLPKLITVNSWNEWTEGTYLEPDNKFGYGYLNAFWRVFVK